MNKHFYMAAENAVRDYKILKEFSENASHEIQTPLAIIHTKLDLLVQQENLTEIQSELIQTVYHSVNKLSTLNKSLLLLAKIDNRQFYKNSDIFLDEVLKNKVNDFQDFWQSKGIAYSVNLEQTLIQTNNELLEILLNNIFSNATRHNIENGSIDILLNNKILQISNSGPSTPLDPERLYKRFYKELPAGENNGLGLSIIKEICTVSAVEINYSYKDERHLFSLTWI
jgi:signal transduction histidine kinase